MHRTKILSLVLHLVLESVLLSLDAYSGAARKLPLLLPQSRCFSLNVGNHSLAWVSALYLLPLNSSSSFENTILDQHHAQILRLILLMIPETCIENWIQTVTVE